MRISGHFNTQFLYYYLPQYYLKKLHKKRNKATILKGW